MKKKEQRQGKRRMTTSFDPYAPITPEEREQGFVKFECLNPGCEVGFKGKKGENPSCPTCRSTLTRQQ